MKHIIQAAGLAAFALVSSAFTSEAHANFRVRLDNFNNPTQLDWAKTNAAVTVQYRITTNGAWIQVGASRVLNTISGSHDFVIVGLEHVAELVKQIKVSIAGVDTFMIDQVELWGIDATGLGLPDALVSSWGSDDMLGWCVSTDTTRNAAQCIGTFATTTKTFTR